VKFKNVLKGARNQKNGASFEQLFKTRCEYSGLGVTRIPDGCKQLGGGRIIRVKSPFDWIVSSQSKTALIDTKVRSKARLTVSDFDQDQALELSKHKGATMAGFVCYLVPTGEVWYYPVGGILTKVLDRVLLGSLDSFDPAKILIS
jgi:hypothetical protein